MKNVVVFAQTVQGHLHIRKEIPCQDASGCYEDPEGRFCIAAIADGHGDPTCVRSDRGSRLAVDVSLECLREFTEASLAFDGGARTYSPLEELLVPGHDAEVVKRLTDALLSRWYDAVLHDLGEEALTDEELERADTYAPRYTSGRDLEHAYGTTLITALKVGPILLLIQQGDGRCVLLREDGTAVEPIPWDSRCHENVTTSISDTDAAESMRHAVVDEREEDPAIAACILGSDGVEDAFHDEDGRWDFCRRLCMRLTETRSAKTRQEDFQQMLATKLPSFSEEGSGDDVSVAGFANMRALMMGRDRFDDLIETHGIEEQLRTAKAKLLSMERMHAHLQDVARSGSEKEVETFERYNAQFEQVQTDISALERDMQALRNRKG